MPISVSISRESIVTTVERRIAGTRRWFMFDLRDSAAPRSAASPTTMVPTRLNDIHTAEERKVVPAKCHIPAHSLSELPDHTDQMSVMMANVPMVRKARGAKVPNRHSDLPRLRFLPCFTSYREFTNTSPPRTDQNTMSILVIGKLPRSQNHWYECRSQVTTNTT